MTPLSTDQAQAVGSPPAEESTQLNPFPGPQPYRYRGPYPFHGRSRVRERLVKQVRAYRCVLLYGASGAGKSSLMLAGVCPTLEDQYGYRVVHIEEWPEAHQPEDWLVDAIYEQLGIGDSPLRKRGLSLRDTNPGPGPRPEPRSEPPAAGDSVHTKIGALEEALRLASLQSDRPILIYLDQLEQILARQRPPLGASTAVAGPARGLFGQKYVQQVLHATEWRRFYECLSHIISLNSLDIRLVLALREDYLGRLAEYTREYRALRDHPFRLAPMTVEEMVDAACEVERKWRSSEPELLQVLLQVCASGQEENRKADIQAAYAQIVCRELWQLQSKSKQPSLAEVIGHKRAQDILEDYCEKALGSLGKERRSDAMNLLTQHMLTSDGISRLLTEKEVSKGLKGVPDPLPLLKALEREHVLHFNQHQGQGYFQIGHDWFANWLYSRRLKEEQEQREQGQQASFRRRLRNTIFYLVLVLIAALGVAGVGYLENKRLEKLYESLQTEKTKADDTAQELESARRAYVVRHQLFVAALQPQSHKRALLKALNSVEEALAERKRFVEDSDLSYILVHLLSGASVSQSYVGHRGEVYSVDFSPDGKRMVSASEEGITSIWDVATGSRRILGASESDKQHASVYVAKYLNPSQVATLDDTGTVRIFNEQTGEQLFYSRHPVRSGRALAHDGKRGIIATGSEDGKVHLWSSHNLQFQQTLDADQRQAVRSIAISPDSTLLASANEDSTVVLWSLQPYRVVCSILGHRSSVRAVAFSADGKLLLTSSEDKKLRLWDTKCKPLGEPTDHEDTPAFTLMFLPQEPGREGTQQLLTGGADGRIRSWKLESQRLTLLQAVPIHTARVYGLAVKIENKKAPAGRTISVASASADHLVRIMDLANAQLARSLRGHQGAVYSVRTSPDLHSRLLATASADQRVCLWNLQTGTEERCTGLLTGKVWSANFTPKGDFLYAATSGGLLHKLDVNKNLKESSFAMHGRQITRVAFSPDGKWGFTASIDGTAKQFPVNDESPQRHTLFFPGHDRIRTDADVEDIQVRSCACSAGGMGSPTRCPVLIATASADKFARVFELTPQGELLARREFKHTTAVKAASISYDCRWLAVGDDDGSLNIWSLDPAQKHAGPAYRLRTHLHSIFSAHFANNGPALVSASGNGTLGIWAPGEGDPDHLTLKMLIEISNARIWDAIFSPDDQSVITAGDDQAVRIYPISLKEISKFGCRWLLQNKTDKEVLRIVAENSDNIFETCSNILEDGY